MITKPHCRFFGKLTAVTLIAAALLLASVFSAAQAGGNNVTVKFLKGTAYKAEKREGPWTEVKVKDSIAEKTYFKTGDESRAELRLPDNSVLRVAKNTIIKISRIMFKEKEERTYKTKLVLGRAWASFRKFFGIRNNVEVNTKNCVAGVRGTTFLTEVNEDESGSLSVYEGKVEIKSLAAEEVSAPKSVGAPREVGGPKMVGPPREVSADSWTLVVDRFQKIYLPASGKPGAPVKFDPKDETDDFIEWNRELDEKEEKPLK